MTAKNRSMFQINEDWQSIFNSEFEQPYFKSLKIFIEESYSQTICFPPINQIFNAFNLCGFKALKVVILGQDPYHGLGQANGLAFSVNPEMPLPPSLNNIFKELAMDLKIPPPQNGDLSTWASQGVLLLNATLSVQEGKAVSHQNQGWEQFTDHVIRTISSHTSNVVFLLWGNSARKKRKLIDAQNHLILESGHPSPLSANRGYWFDNGHFSKVNAYLKSKGRKLIDW
jgi:uracil-DNA glycosylase